MYYVYLTSVYLAQVLKVILTKFLSGYSRGLWIHIITVIQIVIQFPLVVISMV
jgi:hypothetical protein